jgi:hypothetical protein
MKAHTVFTLIPLERNPADRTEHKTVTNFETETQNIFLFPERLKNYVTWRLKTRIAQPQ